MSDDLPSWALRLRDSFVANESSVFLLHGNTQDLYSYQSRYYRLKEFLESVMFQDTEEWCVVFYNPHYGIHFTSSRGGEQSQQKFLEVLAAYTTQRGGVVLEDMPKVPSEALPILESFLQAARLLGLKFAIVIDYLDTLVPNVGVGLFSNEQISALIALQSWSTNAALRASNGIVIMVTELLSAIDQRITNHPEIASIEIPHPSASERDSFIKSSLAGNSKLQCDLPASQFADITSGLRLMQLEDIFLQAERLGKPISREQVLEWKKDAIRKESAGFLEIEEQDHSIKDCPGNDAVKNILARQFQKMREGKSKKVSAGALLVGEIGVGKTYLASAVAFEAGLPVVTIKNLLREFVGLSDANQEKMLALLDAMAPLVVLVPEADVFFGKRKSEGDSGVQSRQFGRYMNFIAHPKNKGRIFWILDTAHPDNLTDDVKRPGRCDLILPLFPFTEENEIFDVLGKIFERLDIETGQLDKEALTNVIETKLADIHSGGYTPSDLTKIATRVEEIAESNKHAPANTEDMVKAFSEFSPGAIAEVREYQRLLAITECTEIQCIPQRYQSLSPDEIRNRLNELKVLLWGRV